MKYLFVFVVWMVGFGAIANITNVALFSLYWWIIMIIAGIIVATPTIRYWEAKYETFFNKK
jgi:hypothetical protein